MRNIKLIICVFLVWGSVSSQCVNEVSTDPYNATNSALPDISGSSNPNNPDVRYRNGFDWINGNADPSTQEYQLTNMNYNLNQPYGNMANIQDANLTGYYRYLNKHNGGGEEMNLENGWELMLINLGKFPDDQTTHAHTTLNSVPYLVFYNKYQGVLRVFVQYGYNEPATSSINGVKIDLSYDNPNKMSGLLRLGDGVDRALDQNSTVIKLTSIAPKTAQNSFWMSSDFQLAYDPCVCYFPSNLSFNFTFFTEQEFKLYGRGISVEESLIDNDNIVDKSFLSNVDYSEGTSENGMIIYKNMESLIDDYIKKMEEYQEKLVAVQQHNAEVEKNIKIAKAVSTIIKLGITAAVGSPAVLDLQGPLAKFFFNSDSKESKETIKKLFGELEKLLGKQLDTYVNKNFQTEATPTPPSAPTAVFSEMHFNGKLISTTDALGPTFHTPGSFVNNPSTVDLPIGGNVYGYPVYNNPVGVFALLEKPKLKMSKSIIDKVTVSNDIELQTSFPNPMPAYHTQDYYTRNFLYQEWTNEYQFQLADEIKYTFNQALDIKEYKISVALVIDPDYNYKNTFSAPYTTKIVSSFTDPINSVNTIPEVDAAKGQYMKLLTTPQFINGFDNGFNYLNSNTWIGPIVINKIDNNINYNKHETPFIPLNSFMPFTASVAVKNTLYHSNKELKRSVIYVYGNQTNEMNFPINAIPPYPFENFESMFGMNYLFTKPIKLKLKIDVIYNSLNDQGLNNESTFIYTYDIDPSEIVVESNQFVSNLASSNSNIAQFEEDLFIGTTHFSGQVVDGCKLVGNNYTCQAWNDVTINGDLTVANGYFVTINAGNEVLVYPQSNISPEIVLQINPILDFSNPVFEVDPSLIEGFCKGTNPNLPKYLANMGNKSIQDSNQVVVETTTIQETKQPFSFSLFPNPTTQQTTVKVNGEYADQVSIVVYDIAGKEQRVAISGEGGRFNLDVAHLAKGLYLVKVSTFGESQTKQLVIN